MDAMYLNLMFINPRPPSAGRRRPLYTAVVAPPPPAKILDPRLSVLAILTRIDRDRLTKSLLLDKNNINTSCVMQVSFSVRK